MKEEKRSSILYRDEDADLSMLENRIIGIIGYGNQGRSQALNIRDTKTNLKDILIGSVRDESWVQAEKDGFKVYPISEVCERADIIFMLIPDEVMGEVYAKEVEPYLEGGNVLNFSSGYNITYGFIEPPKHVDVIMVAPRMGGKEVRERYERGNGFPSFLAVHQDASGKAKKIALAIGKAIGSTKGGSILIGVTFDQETFSDLLSEQFLAPVIMNAWVTKYEADLEAGVPPEAALLELHLSGEWAEDFQRMAEMGIVEQLPLHSKTSQYGQLTRAAEFDPTQLKAFVDKQARKIKNGEFAREWAEERKQGYPVLKRMYKMNKNSPMIKKEQEMLEKLGRKTREEREK